MKFVSTLVICLLLLQFNAIARDYRQIYTQEDLKSAHAIYSKNIYLLLTEDLAAYLMPDELKSLSRVKLLQPWNRMLDPFEFSANPKTGEILIPTFSVKFFDDLSVAYAWYEKNQCDSITVMDYAIALDYSKIRIASPFSTLNIPKNIYDEDAYVKDVAQKMLKDAVSFLLLHELGHIHHKHKSYQSISAIEAQRQETEADSFALNVYRRMQLPPLGASFWFMLVAYRDPLVPHSPSQTHPLTGERLRMIAKQLNDDPGAFINSENRKKFTKSRIQSIASELDKIASMIERPRFREFLIYRGENITPELLQQGCSPDRSNKWMQLFKVLTE